MRHPSNHLFDHTPETLRAWCADAGMPHYRADQLLEWVYGKGVCDPALMTNLSARDREILAERMTFTSGATVSHQSASDGTQKLLVEWDEHDDPGAPADPLRVLGDSSRQTECVMIPSMPGESPRKTACVSSQIGCPVGCRFCASGLGGLDGNLTTGRIVEQVWRLARLDDVGRISNVVFMGMGEPLANFSNVVNAVRTLAAPWGPNIGARRITISTVGLPQAIERLAAELELPVTLALSLHAPNDEIRRDLIPWASYTSVDDLLSACRKWFEKTGREITLEYTLMRGVNDRPEHAEQLATVAKRIRANINLIRYNEVGGLEFKRPRTEDVHEFQRLLRARGLNAHLRASRGRDIAAACGQLRHEKAGAEERGEGGA